MKKFVKEFCLRGLLAMGFGPVILAVIYGILGAVGVTESLSPAEVTKGILSITLMAFIAAGSTAIYQTERLPLPLSILIHAGVLYLDYLVMYLFNDWIPKNFFAIGTFSAIFCVGFALVWIFIYFTNKNSTKALNKTMSAK